MSTLAPAALTLATVAQSVPEASAIRSKSPAASGAPVTAATRMSGPAQEKDSSVNVSRTADALSRRLSDQDPCERATANAGRTVPSPDNAASPAIGKRFGVRSPATRTTQHRFPPL